MVGPVTAGDRVSSPTRHPLVAGVDGCRAGWVLAVAAVAERGGAEGAEVDGGASGNAGRCLPLRGEIEVSVVPDFASLAAAVRAGTIAAAGVDIPIGLTRSGPRHCDVEARRMLGPRRSSVFPAPVRSALAAATYEDACARSRHACGRGISKQLFNILPKIREVDAAMATAPELQDHVFEMCPELSLAVMASAPMAHAKRTREGRDERLAALRTVFGDVAALTARPPAGAAPDDVLDAIAGLWSAARFAYGSALCLGADAGERDENGLRMAVFA